MILRAGPLVCALALGALGGVLLGGCGGGTQTVSVSGAPAPGGGGPHTTGASRAERANGNPSPTTSSTTSSAPTGTTQGGPQATSTTRTAPAPAFVHPGGGQSSEQGDNAAAAAAAQVVRAQGYSPQSLTIYHPNQTLRVLIGTRDRSTAGYNQRAFFFLDNRYLGTDSSQPSASVQVVGQSDTEVTLAYALYRPGDHECCPSGGQATVHFQLNNGQLVPLDPIPPASSTAALSRQ